MGFRTGSYATIWEVSPVSNTITKGRISISRKNQTTGEYETDFSGFVSFVGSASASKALSLRERDRIRLGDVDVRSSYNKDKGITYHNFNIFTFETANGQTTGAGPNGTAFDVQGDMKSVDEEECLLPF